MHLRVLFAIAAIALAASVRAETGTTATATATATTATTTTTMATTTMPPSFAPTTSSITLLRTIPPPAARQLDSEPTELTKPMKPMESTQPMDLIVPLKTSPVHNERRALKKELQEAPLRTVPPLNGPTFAEGTNDRVLTAAEGQGAQPTTAEVSHGGVELLRTIPPPLMTSPVFPLRTSPVHNGRRVLRGTSTA